LVWFGKQSVGGRLIICPPLAIMNITLDVNLMGMIILKLRPECLVVFTETLFCTR
jgi:hypothetical protein